MRFDKLKITKYEIQKYDKMLSHCIACKIHTHYREFYSVTKKSKEIEKICLWESNFFHGRKYLPTTRRRDNRIYLT